MKERRTGHGPRGALRNSGEDDDVMGEARAPVAAPNTTATTEIETRIFDKVRSNDRGVCDQGMCVSVRFE
jgi:hypothetical protein